MPFLTQYDLTELNDAKLTRMVEITREPLTILSDITNDVPYFFGDAVAIELEVEAEVLSTETSQKVLKEIITLAEEWNFDDEESLHHTLDAVRGQFKEQGIKPKETMWAIRAAVTGRVKGADICAVLAILGKDKVIARIKKAVK